MKILALLKGVLPKTYSKLLGQPLHPSRSAPMAPRPSTLSPTPSASLNLAPNHNPGRVQSPVVANSITTATGAQLVAKGRAARQQKQSAEEPQPSGSNSNLNFAPKEHSEKAASDSDSSSSAAAKNGRKRPESGSPAGAQRASKRGRRDSTATEVCRACVIPGKLTTFPEFKQTFPEFQ